MKGALARLSDLSGISLKRHLWLHLALVVVLLACGAAFRLYRLHEESLWLDEHITWSNLDLPGLHLYLAQLRERDATFVPAYYVLLYYWAGITDYSILAARLLSVSFGLATMLLVYVLAVGSFGPTAGIVALAMTAFSNSIVYYDQEVRVYALYAAAALLSVWSLERALHRPRPVWWVLHQAANLVLVLSHYFGALFVLTEGVYLLLFHRRPVRRLLGWFAAQAVLALLLFLWMLGIRQDVLETTTTFLMPPPLENLEYAFTWAALYWPRSLYEYAWLTRIPPILVLLFCAYCFFTRRTSETHGQRWRRAALLLMLMTLPMAATVAATYAVRPAITLRYVVPASLPFFILLGGAVGTLPGRLLRRGVVVLLLGVLCMHQFEAARPYRPNLGRAGRLLAEAAPTESALLLEHTTDTFTQRIYLAHPEERRYYYREREQAASLAASLLEEYPAVWILGVFDYARGYASHEELEAGLREQGLLFETIEVSADHYTFNTNSSWPALADVGRRIRLYRVTGLRLETGSRVRNMRPAAISIFSS